MRTCIIASVTADGFIARDSDDFSMDWTSKEDVQLFVRLTKEAGVIVFGSTTAQTVIDAGRRLPGRRKIVYTRGSKRAMPEGFETTSEAPAELLARLEKEGASGVAICGGSQVYTLFLRAGVVDELYLTIEPKLFGSGVPFLGGSLECDLSLIDVQQLNQNTVLLHYRLSQRSA